MEMPDRHPSQPATVTSSLARLAEHHVLFPLFGLLLLGGIWGGTAMLLHNEQAAVERTTRLASSELAETYEAQVVRALREIDQTLRLIQYAQQREGNERGLQALKERELLLPGLVFAVNLTDAEGNIVASTQAPERRNLADQDGFSVLQDHDELTVSRPQRNAAGDWTLQFSRRLGVAGGRFEGIATVSADAAYFVSGYDVAKLGERGVLGILGTDGLFRVRRSGDTVSAGEIADYKALAGDGAARNDSALLVSNAWDGEERYTSVRQLYQFPLLVLVGLSRDEQLTASRRDQRAYLWTAGFSSLLLMLFLAVLWRLSRQLALARRRESEARLAHAERIEYMAYHDVLTGLPNRALFTQLLAQSISQARRHRRQLAVLFLDLDNFKQVNDTLGHEAGDALLKEVGLRLRRCLRDSDSVARLGGDEFVVLVPELPSEDDVAVVARKMLAAVAQPFKLVGHDFSLTVSIGISLFPQHGEDEQTLKQHADIAMYLAKEQGKNNFKVYSEAASARSLERQSLESNLRLAVERSEFALHYQAKRDASGQRITGMEALLRWQHPQLGLVAPMKFIPLAEEMGLMPRIGRWVFDTACRQNVAWQKEGLPPLRIAVDLTAKQFFDDALLADVRRALDDSGMAPGLLELEVNEAVLTQNMDKTVRILAHLKQIGVRIAIDNFGVGYASISKLKHLQIDTVKIDRSFIRDIVDPAMDNQRADAIIAMGRSLNLTVVAQGVETEQQADFLRQHACDEMQGFFFSKPMAVRECSQMLQAQLVQPPAAVPGRA
jgi:diguanylate cyclase (GGDEF)-like protein